MMTKKGEQTSFCDRHVFVKLLFLSRQFRKYRIHIGLTKASRLSNIFHAYFMLNSHEHEICYGHKL